MEGLEDLLYDLNTLGTVRINDRINTAEDHLVIEQASILQGIWRWKSQDNRKRTINTISKLAMTIIAVSDSIVESKYLAIEDIADVEFTLERISRVKNLESIHDAIKCALVGLRNLSLTYESDADAKFKFNKIISSLENQLNKLYKILYTDNYNKEKS
jgi:hypothetical protein